MLVQKYKLFNNLNVLIVLDTVPTTLVDNIPRNANKTIKKNC